MMRRSIFVVVVMVVLGFPATATADPPPQCFITGGGNVEGDSFGGSARSTNDLEIDGTWHHRSADGRTMMGDVEDLLCRRNGGQAGHPSNTFSLADWGGKAVWDGMDGYTFVAHAQDHGEGNHEDAYFIGVSDADGNVVYSGGGLIDSGNFQIHATNPGHS